MGISGSKSKQTTQSQTVQTPNVPSWIQQPTQDLYSRIGAMSKNATDYTTPASVNQQQAFTRAQAGTPGVDSSLLNYNPAMLRDTNLAPYMNPYEGSVVMNALNDIEQQRARAISSGQGAATAAGAYGGSRHGVADSLTNEAALREAASTASNLRYQGYANAQDRAQSDLTRQDQGAAFRLGAWGANNENTRADTAQMADLGAEQRSIDSMNNPNVAQLSLLQSLQQLLGANPALFTGQTSNTNATSTTSQSPGLMDILGTIAQAAGAFTGNPFLVAGGTAVKK